MLLKFCDIFNTLCQAILFVWVPYNIALKENRISKLKSTILMAMIFMEVVVFTYSGIHSSVANFLMVVIILTLTAIFYRKSIIDAFVGFGLAYGLNAIIAYFLVTLYQNILAKLNLQIVPEVQILMFIYIPVWIIYILFYKYRRYIFNAAIFMKNLKHSLIFVILINIALIILDTLRIDWTIESMGITFKFFIYLMTFIGFVFAAVYFAKVQAKSKEVERLNIVLNEKITELKKLKHDYGSEISSLYGLYQLKKYDRIGEILKSIVERYQSLAPEISLNQQSNPIVASVMHSAASAGINIVTIDDADYENLVITDNELLKIVSNIVRNSVDALVNTKNPIIKFRSHNNYHGIVITIVNNGPQIPEHIQDKIFQSGFSTKANGSGDRGYGLSIVTDIINKCGGKISLQSNQERTQFTIEIPKVIF